MTQERRTFKVVLELSRFPTTPQDIEEGRCVACDGYLELHQPDVASPERMIGVCEDCCRWYIIDMVPGSEEAVMVLVPDAEAFKDIQADRSEVNHPTG